MENIYIQGVSVNGKDLDRAWFEWDEIANGGILRYRLGKEPNTEWAKGLPPSMSEIE